MALAPAADEFVGEQNQPSPKGKLSAIVQQTPSITSLIYPKTLILVLKIIPLLWRPTNFATVTLATIKLDSFKSPFREVLIKQCVLKSISFTHAAAGRKGYSYSAMQNSTANSIYDAPEPLPMTFQSEAIARSISRRITKLRLNMSGDKPILDEITTCLGISRFPEALSILISRPNVKVEMCIQEYLGYQCGCRMKGEFKQCNAKYHAQSNLQCARTNVVEVPSRCYCPKHLPKDNKAITRFVGRQDNR
ncbi:hypothetical protein MMC22_000970 [Lobaria immixta]|nr:hypothetical protein [Lobaria immixta]